MMSIHAYHIHYRHTHTRTHTHTHTHTHTMHRTPPYTTTTTTRASCKTCLCACMHISKCLVDPTTTSHTLYVHVPQHIATRMHYHHHCQCHCHCHTCTHTHTHLTPHTEHYIKSLPPIKNKQTTATTTQCRLQNKCSFVCVHLRQCTSWHKTNTTSASCRYCTQQVQVRSLR